MNFRWRRYLFALVVTLLVVAVLAFGVDSDTTGNKLSATPTPAVSNLLKVWEAAILPSGLLGTYFTYTKNSL